MAPEMKILAAVPQMLPMWFRGNNLPISDATINRSRKISDRNFFPIKTGNRSIRTAAARRRSGSVYCRVTLMFAPAAEKSD